MKYVKTNKHKNELTVYYPVDNGTEYESRMKKGGNALWMKNPEKKIKAVQHSTGGKVPTFFCKPFVIPKMNALEDGSLAGRFSNGEEPIRPIIFSHGWTGANFQYSGFARDMASHGYLVILINHQDGTCFYTEKEDGTPVFYEKGDYYQKEVRVRQQGVRIEEVTQLINELKEESELKEGSSKLVREIFGASSGVKVDMTHLVLSGHSFGG